MLILLLALVLILFVRTFLFIQVEVPTTRADLGLLAGDRIVVDRTRYGVRWPQTSWSEYCRWGDCSPALGSLVAYDYPDDSGRISIDRVVALPEDTLWLDEETFIVVPSGAYGVGNIILPEEQIIGCPVLISYSVDLTRPFYKLLRRKRLFVEIR